MPPSTPAMILPPFTHHHYRLVARSLSILVADPNPATIARYDNSPAPTLLAQQQPSPSNSPSRSICSRKLARRIRPSCRRRLQSPLDSGDPLDSLLSKIVVELPPGSDSNEICESSSLEQPRAADKHFNSAILIPKSPSISTQTLIANLQVLMDDKKEEEAIEELSKTIAFKPDLQLIHLRVILYDSMIDTEVALRNCEATVYLGPRIRTMLIALISRNKAHGRVDQ